MPTEATRFLFTDEQRQFIDAYRPDLERLVHEHDPEMKGNCQEITKWKKKTAAAIMNRALFANLPDSESREAWASAIERRFSNYVNNKLKRRWLSSQEPTRTIDEIDPASKKGPRYTLVHLKSANSTRELFASKNKDRINAAAKAIRDERRDLSGSAAHLLALANMWKEADQKFWEGEAKKLAGDVNSNQAEFPQVMERSLKTLCARGFLGSTAMTLSFAFRKEDGELVHNTIYAAYDADTELRLPEPGTHDRVTSEAWINYAERMLPRKIIKLVAHIPRNRDGLPIFPDLNVKSGSIVQLADTIKDYLVCLWEFSWSSGKQRPPVIPWMSIAAGPDKYYDTRTFAPPVALQEPNPDDFFAVLKLVEYFMTQSQGNRPFRFYPKEEITKRITEINGLEVDEGFRERGMSEDDASAVHRNGVLKRKLSGCDEVDTAGTSRPSAKLRRHENVLSVEFLTR